MKEKNNGCGRFTFNNIIPLFAMLILISSSFISMQAQSKAEIFDSAMDAYGNRDYGEAHRLFEQLTKHDFFERELFSSVFVWDTESLMNLGLYDAVISGYEYYINRFTYAGYRPKILYTLGTVYFQLGEYTKSRNRFLQLIEEFPYNEYYYNAQYWIGETFLRQENYERALEYLKGAGMNLVENQYYDYTIFSTAHTYENLGDYHSAVENYEKILNMGSRTKLTGAAQYRIGICYFYLGEYEHSILELTSPDMKNLTPEKKAEALYLLANSYYRTGEFDAAATTYESILQENRNPEITRNVQYALAWAYFQKKEYLKSYGLFDILSNGADSIAVQSMFYKAETKRYSGADTEALRIYEEFVEKYPGNDFSSKAHFNSGIIYYNRKYYALANKSLLLSVASVDPSLRARAYTLLGEIALQENRYEAALQYFETAQKVERVPDDLVNRALFGLAAASFYLSDYDRTIPLLESVEKNDGSFEPNKVAFYIAEASFRKGEYERAYSYYEQIPSSDPLLGPSVQYGKAYCNYNLQQYERAVYAFKDFMQTYPDDRRITDAKVRLADSYFAVKDFALAAQMYEELLKDKTTEGRDYVMYQHALALQNTGRSNNAIDQLQKLVKNYPASKYTENSRYLIGWIHFQQYNFYDAIEGYKNALPKIKTEAMRPLIYYSLGDCYYNLAEYDSALAYYNRITGSYPSSPYVFDAVNGMQLCYQAQGDYDMAVEVIDNYVSSNPNAPFSDKLFLKQGELYYGIGEYEKARESYTEFLQRYTQSEFVPDAHYWLGKSASMLGMEEEAITHYKIVLHNYPNNLLAADAVVEIGSIHIEAERYEAAAEIFDQAILRLKESPRLPELYYLKGIAMKHMDEKGSAYDLFDHVATYYGDNIYADKSRLELGILEMDARRYDKALELFKQLFSKRSDDIGAAAQYYHGLTHFKQNNYNDAITSFVRVPNLYGAYEEWVAKAMLNMGLCYERKNDFDEAASIYRNVFRKHRGDEFGDEAKLRLENIEQ